MKNKIKSSIGAKLIIAFLFVSILPVTLSGIISYYNTKNALKNEINTNISSLVHSRAYHIENLISISQNIVVSASSLNLFRENLENIKKGRDVLKSTTTLTEALKAWQLSSNLFYRAKILDINGKVIATTMTYPNDLGTNRSDREYFKKGLIGLYVSEPYISRDDSIPNIVYSCPVFALGSKSDVAGVIVLYNAMLSDIKNVKINGNDKNINQVITNTEGLGKSGETYLVNQEGLIISNTSIDGDLFLSGKIDKELLSKLVSSDKIVSFINLHGKSSVGMAERIKGTNWVLIAEYDYDEAFAPIRKLGYMMLIFGGLVLIVVLILAFYISEYFRKPIVELTNKTKAAATGDLDQRVAVKVNDEIGVLSESFNEMQISQKKVVQHANKLAEGDYSGTIEPKSEYDELAASLNKMTLALKRMTFENAHSDWLKTGQNKLSDRMRGIEDLQILCSNILAFMSEYLNAQIGVIYLRDEEADNYVLKASYAFSDAKKLIKKGEGLIGHAAFEQKVILNSDIPDGYFRISSALGDTIPKNIIAIPLINSKTTEGVIELGSLKTFSERELEFIGQVAESIAISISSVKAHQKQKELLSELKKQQLELSGQMTAINRSNIVMELDIDGTILKVNHIFEDLYGYTEEEIVGKHHSLILDDVSKNTEEYKSLWDKLRSGQFQSGEYQRKTKSGNVFWIQGSFNPVFNEEGKPYKILSIGQDITHIKMQQELLEEQKEELEIQHNTLEETNIQLELQTEKIRASEEELRVQHDHIQAVNLELEEQAQLLEEKNLAINETNMAIERFRTELEQKAEALEITSKFKSEFLANMSHELRTPLNSILLLSKLLSDNKAKNLTSDQIEYSKVINSSGQGLLQLINEILDLSKIEAGKMDIEIASVQVNEVAENLKSIFKPLADSKGIMLNISVEDQVTENFSTDRMRLEQILRNLLSNALKFTQKGSVSLQIQKKNNGISFSVTDTGIGIPKDKQNLIFEAFQQADGSTKRKFGGTGLGLSISRELAKLLGGEIVLESEEGKGSTFSLILPFESDTAANLSKTALTINKLKDESHFTDIVENPHPNFVLKDIPTEIPDDRNEINEKDKVILIVEDDVNFAGVLLQSVKQKGYKGIVVVRGDLALTFAENYQPAGILLDLQLPVMDGWTVMEQLKSNKKTKHIPVHIMSSYDGKRESLKRGALDFIPKPVAFEKIEEVLSRIETMGNKTKKKLLIIEDNETHSKALADFLQTDEVECLTTNTIPEGMKIIETKEIDCVILDMAMPDTLGYEVMENIRKNHLLESMPIIVYTGKSLSIEEENKIKTHANAIILKTAQSYERLLDETNLFLHLVNSQSDEEKESRLKPYYSNTMLEGKTVLIVDDDMRNVYSITKALENYRMKVITAGTGDEALEQLKKNNKIEIILMDLMMPGMDGLEAMKNIRMIKDFEKLPIIAVTAKAMLGDRAKCIDAGASDYISKPVDIDQLLSLIRVWLYK
jgi:PAS domain S-box-containing protein